MLGRGNFSFSILEGLAVVHEEKNPNEVTISCRGGTNIKFPKKKVDLDSNTFALYVEAIARDILAWHKEIILEVYDYGDRKNLIFDKVVEGIRNATYRTSDDKLSDEDVKQVGKLIKIILDNRIMGTVM